VTVLLKAVKILFLLPVFWSILFIASILLYIFAYLPRSFSGHFYHYLARLWCRLFVLSLNVKLCLVKKHQQPVPEQFILIANHPSALEDFAIPALFDVYPLAKTEVRDWFILGRISDYAGSVYVDRENSRSRYTALQSLASAVELGKNIVIFPEGGCKGKRIHTEFKTGAFEIALRTGIPVLPVFLHYLDQDAFVWRDESLIKKLWQIFRAKDKRANYYLHDAISPSGYSNKLEFAEAVRQKYLDWQRDYLD